MWNAGAVNIGIHQSNPAAERFQSAGQRRRDRAFSNTAFATAHRNDIVDVQPDSSPGVLSTDCWKQVDIQRLALGDQSRELFFHSRPKSLRMRISWCQHVNVDVDRRIVTTDIADPLQFSQGALDFRINDLACERPDFFRSCHELSRFTRFLPCAGQPHRRPRVCAGNPRQPAVQINFSHRRSVLFRQVETRHSDPNRGCPGPLSITSKPTGERSSSWPL